jgi:hydrogenase maturation factor HypF (carbamoyltransferase family)
MALNKDYQSAAYIATDENGITDYKWLCDLHPGFRSEIMDMSATKIVNRLDIKESYAHSLQHYAYESFAKERIKKLNKKK